MNRLGYYFPYEKSGITGIPDTEVFAALKAFQKDQGLQPTGAARLGVTESKKETKQEFEQLSKEHEILRTKARYEVENLTLIRAQFENAKMELEKVRQALEECQQSKT